MIIYKVTNTISNKVYIGQTIQTLPQRQSVHRKTAKNGSETNFHRALRKYSKRNWKWEVLETVKSAELLNEREIFHIREYDAYKSGYNMTEGGDGGLTYKKGTELYERIKHKLGKWENGNPGATPIAIKKRLETFKSVNWPSGETHGNYGTHPEKPSLRGSGNPMYGKTPTNARRVEVDGIVYKSVADAARKLDTNNNTIRRRCLNEELTNYKYK